MPIEAEDPRHVPEPATAAGRRQPSARPLADLAVVLALVAVAVVFWRSPLMFPVKAFVVLLHELGHAVAALVTGGSVDRIELAWDLGGACWSAGGWNAAVLPAGYLGSMTFGGLILVGASRWQRDRRFSAVLGLGVLAVTIVLVRTLFGVLFGLGFAAALVACAAWLPERANDLVLKFLGLTSILYAVVDIKEDLVSRTVAGSDAWAMSESYFFPPVFWGVLWMAAAVVAAAVFLWLAGRPAGAGATDPPADSRR